jgi:hypothetical protein
VLTKQVADHYSKTIADIQHQCSFLQRRRTATTTTTTTLSRDDDKDALIVLER